MSAAQSPQQLAGFRAGGSRRLTDLLACRHERRSVQQQRPPSCMHGCESDPSSGQSVAPRTRFSPCVRLPPSRFALPPAVPTVATLLCRPAAGFSTAVAPSSVTSAAAASGMAPTVYATKNPHVISCGLSTCNAAALTMLSRAAQAQRSMLTCTFPGIDGRAGAAAV